MAVILNHQLLNPPKKYSEYSLSARTSKFKSIYEEKSFDQPEARMVTYIFAPDNIVEMKQELVANGFLFNARNETLKCSSCKATLKDPKNFRNNHDRSCKFSIDMQMDKKNYGYSLSSDDETDGKFQVSESKLNQSQRNDQSDTIKNNINSKNSSKLNQAATGSYKKSVKCLIEENRRMKEELICRSCRSEKVQTLFLPCRHLVTCEPCADKLDLCCRCDAKILGTVRTYMV